MGAIIVIDGKNYRTLTKGAMVGGKKILFDEVVKNPQKYLMELVTIIGTEGQRILEPVETQAEDEESNEDTQGGEVNTDTPKRTSTKKKTD